MATIQIAPHVREMLNTHGFERRVTLPIKMVSNMDAVINTALSKSVVGVIAVLNPDTGSCDHIKNTIQRVRPNAYTMCLFDEGHPSNIISIYYK
ncbi:MAG: hypothetical protein QXX62_00630 [Metallosphaera sp.]|uniref:hypothetical protein n=1 Tax=Metallosphaera TaxID=41980 RepID=UPI001F0653C4|nr:hypothetical protein [Metallosphaera sedula]MCH1770100.1 hypothetical protein [Metallosphaera sedula]MCP6728066.1 hypothetical protein [Metallosphaera sedula]